MSGLSSESELNLVYVTGFGLFGEHKEVNASWEAVRLLPKEHTLPDGKKCQLKLLEVPVTYCDVDAAVKKIWEENPKVKKNNKVLYVLIQNNN